MSHSANQDRVLQEFRVAVRRALEYGFDSELLQEEIERLWRQEFEGEGDED